MLVKLRLKLHGFKLNHRKSQISRAQVKFLGFSLTEGKVIPCEDRLKTFSIMPFQRIKINYIAHCAQCVTMVFSAKDFINSHVVYTVCYKKMYIGCGHIHIPMLSISCVLKFQEK